MLLGLGRRRAQKMSLATKNAIYGKLVNNSSTLKVALRWEQRLLVSHT